ncbi:NAD(P)-dependent oxidoreductase [Undibacterium fentianense]|uniref:NAD(P)-dependent oxidoreductase n=1 Tax=Undibacterium fentianense TaxID=2828728 RepID=A0A941IFW6_9BURK|nr:NAD(P)-dependent oxidoreductase [Undibacterium fentianense]MBR7800777.1 NAD(P)-dependent oxidoreductase [Undibacterium fentianense]
MKIALIGASGFIGSAIRQELLKRGHQVSALVGHPEKLASHPQLLAIASDVQNLEQLRAQVIGHDAIISAFSGHAQSDTLHYYLNGFKNVLAASKAAGVQRLLVVGGAGSLEVAPGLQLIDTPHFPAEYKATAEGARQALNLLREETNIQWSMLSPAAVIAPGQHTGKFRLGKDQLLSDAQGESRISVEDYAQAMVDELEQPQHICQRFSIAN